MASVPSDNPFRALGLPETFALTAAQVAAAHVAVMARHHPDRAGSALERDELVRASALAGQAKQRLISDIGRAEALLEVRGAQATDAPLAPEFLAETLELRELIEEAVGDADATAAIELRTRAMRTACVTELAAALDGAANPSAAHAALARLRYIERMLVRLQESDPGAH